MDEVENPERARLSELYSGMTDPELLRVANDPDALTDTALEVLEAEAERRGLQLELDEPDEPPTPEFSGLVTVAQFRDLHQAWLAQGALQAAGIKAFLADDNLVRMDWLWSNAIGGVRLCVRQEDFRAALDRLAEPVPASFEVEGVGEYEQPRCPRCGSPDVSAEGHNHPASYASLFLVPVPLRAHYSTCNACGAAWIDEDTPDG